jgi:pimeloyl-ACP methyl ester carboxylesterase
MAVAAGNIGIDRFNLMGTSFGGRVALWLAVLQPERVDSLVLEAPAAIRPVGSEPPSGSPEEMARRLYAHPERVGPFPLPDQAIQAKTRALVARLRGPDRDADLEKRMRELATPVLVLFGTRDHVIPPEMGHFYRELLPNCHLVFVYDAGHAISTERPEAFAEVTLDFLERREAFVVSRAETVIHP